MKPRNHLPRADKEPRSARTSLLRPRRTSSDSGFTRLEAFALAVSCVLLLLIAIPALGGNERKSQALDCLSNFRRLSLAWVLFANDHDGNLVINRHGGEAQNPGGIPQAQVGWVSGWLDWSTSTHNTNTLFLSSDRYSAMAAYYDHDPTILRCPADRYLSAPQRARGWTQRVRSYVGNLSVGVGNANTGPLDPAYDQVRRITDFAIPGPADSMVFLEEHPDSINDPAFFSPQKSYWIDLPASQHSGGAVFSFGDGHVTLRRWESQKVKVPVRFQFTGVQVPASDPDIRWFRFHTPRKTEDY